jgi:hypothetical protein
MNRGGLVLGALVAALAVSGIAWFAMSMDGPVEPANKAAVVKARKNYLRLARSYQSGYRHYEGRKRWARQMNKVCHDLNRRQTVILRRVYRTGRLQSAIALIREGQRVSELALDRASRVRPAAADRARVRRMFALYDRSMSFADAEIDALARRDLPTFRRLEGEAAVPNGWANKIATALGARICTRDIG